MFLWEVSNTGRKAKFKNCLLPAAKLFNTYCIWSRLLLPSFIAHARKTSSSFPQFGKQQLLTTMCWLHCVHFSKLGSKFESTVELNYLGWHKLVLDSAHVKFDVWTGPQIVLDEEENYKLLTLPMSLETSQKAKELSTTETTMTAHFALLHLHTLL